MRQFSRTICAALILLLTACAPAVPTPTLTPAPTTTPLPPTPEAAPPTSTPETAQFIVDTTAPPAYLRIVHASQDIPPVDITVDRSVIANHLAFATYTESTPISVGQHIFRVRAAGSLGDAAPLLENNFAVESDQALILLLTGANDAPRIIALPEALGSLRGGQSRVSIIHAAPNTPNVTLQLDGTDITEPVSFGSASSGVTMPAGETVLTFQSDDQKLLDYRLTLRERVSYTLVLTGTADNLSIVRYATRVVSQSRIRVVNATIPALPIDVYADNTPISANPAFGKFSEYITLSAGQHTAAVYPADADPATSTPLASTQVVLGEDADVALIVIGTRADLRIVPWRETHAPTPSNQARVAFMHTLPDTPDAYVAQSAMVLADLPPLPYGQPPTQISLEAGVYDLLWRSVEASDSNEARLETAHALDFQAGFNYLYLLSGATDAPVILSERVGIDPNLDTTLGTTPMPFVPAWLRLVSALGSQTAVDLYVDDTRLASGVAYGQSSAFADTPTGSHTISIRTEGSAEEQVSVDFDLAEGGRYSVFVYGEDGSVAQMLVVEDSNLIFDTQWARIRLVNLSVIQGALLGLASTQAFPSVMRGSDDPRFDAGDRLTLPFGAQQYISNINSGAVSTAVSIPAGSYDLFIVDMQRFGVARRLNNVRMETEQLHDVVAFQAANSARVDAFVVPYPAR